MSAKRHVLEITPTEAQLRQLLADLQILRERTGAASNTAAILDAVHEAAYGRRDHEAAERRRHAPGPTPGGKS